MQQIGLPLEIKNAPEDVFDTHPGTSRILEEHAAAYKVWMVTLKQTFPQYQIYSVFILTFYNLQHNGGPFLTP